MSNDRSKNKVNNQEIINEIKLMLESNDQQLSEREICTMISLKYEKKVETIRSLWKYKKKKKNKQHGNQLLTDEDESILVGVLEAFSLSHSPLSKTRFLSLVKKFHSFPSGWTGFDWYRSFLKRHKTSLSSRTVQAIQEERVSRTVLEDTKSFIEVVGNFLSGHYFSSEVIVNADETRISIKGNLFGTEYVESTKKYKSTHKSKKNTKTAGLVVFASAAGNILLSVYLLPTTFNKNHDIGTASYSIYNTNRVFRKDWQRLYLFTENGYLNDEAWNEIMESYISLTRNIWPGLHNVLFLDRLGAHMQPETVKKCLDNNIHTLFLVANSSHFMQPLDDNIFTNYKRVLSKKSREYIEAAALHNQKITDTLVAVSPETEKEAFTKQAITSSFMNTGIWPFNPTVLLANAEINSPQKNENEPPEELSIEDKARKAALLVLETNIPVTKTKKIKFKVKKNKVYTPQELFDLEEQQELEKCKLREEKEQRGIIRQEKKRKRDEELKQKETERIAKKQKKIEEKQEKETVNTCRVCARRRNRSKNWISCKNCGKWWLCADCFRKTDEMKEHEKICSYQNEILVV